MGSVTIRDTVEKVGECSISTVEYVFEEYSDFVAWKDHQSKQLKDSLIDIFGGIGEVEDALQREEQQADIVDISVGKKKTEPTKH